MARHHPLNSIDESSVTLGELLHDTRLNRSEIRGSYAATLKNDAKTADMKKSTIKKFATASTYTGDVTRKLVQRCIAGDNQATVESRLRRR